MKYEKKMPGFGTNIPWLGTNQGSEKCPYKNSPGEKFDYSLFTEECSSFDVKRGTFYYLRYDCIFV